MKTSRNRGKRELVHPVFMKCKESVENGFWKTLFEEMAYGKYPKQFYITQQQVIHSSIRDAFQYNFSNKTVEEIIHDVQELLTLHTNIISNEDMDVKKLENEKYKKDTWNQWKDVKKKYIRDILLMEYCIGIKNELNLSNVRMQEVYQTITNLLNKGEIHDIELKDNKIIHIKGVLISKEDKTISISLDSTTIKEECIFPCPDTISIYCKRYLMRYTQFKDKK